MKRYIKSARTSKAYTEKSTSLLKSKLSPLSAYRNKGFDRDQLEEIRKGFESEVDVSLYADPKFNSDQMWQIRKGLESGFDVSLYADPKFDSGQMREIREGLKSRVDIRWYADPKFDWKQMSEIREGFESGVDVSWCADPEFNWRQMRQVKLGLESGVDVSLYADPKFDAVQMSAIRRYANDPLLESTPVEDIVKANEKDMPSLAYLGAKNKYQKAKLDWQSVKDAAASREPLDIPALEEELDLGALEGRAAYTLGVSFDEASDGSIIFDLPDGSSVTISSTRFDTMVRTAIANSSTRQSFAKAFATQMKRQLGL